MAWAAYMLTRRRCRTGRSTRRSRTSPWFNFQLDLGALPLGGPARGHPLGRELPAGAGVGRPARQGPGAGWSGGVYAANTLGAIVGSLGASLLLVAWLGSQHAQQFLIAVAATSALLMLAAGLGGTAAGTPGGRFATVALIACLGVGAVLLGARDSPIPGAAGRATAATRRRG